MVRVFVTMLVLAGIYGCGLFTKRDPVIVYKTVETAVYQCPKQFNDMERIDRPELIIFKLDKKSPNADTVKAYKATIKQLQTYAAGLEVFQDLVLGTCPLQKETDK